MGVYQAKAYFSNKMGHGRLIWGLSICRVVSLLSCKELRFPYNEQWSYLAIGAYPVILHCPLLKSPEAEFEYDKHTHCFASCQTKPTQSKPGSNLFGFVQKQLSDDGLFEVLPTKDGCIWIASVQNIKLYTFEMSALVCETFKNAYLESGFGCTQSGSPV